MKKYYVFLLFLCMLFLGACNNIEDDDRQTISLGKADLIHIDHGSTALEVESADIESLEVSSFLHKGFVIEEGKQTIKIRPKSDVRRMLNIGKTPSLSIRIPTSYEGKLTVDGSSGNVNIKNINVQQLDIQGSSGSVSLEYLEINSNINVSVKSGNILLNLKDKNSSINWLLQSGSGRRSIAIPIDNRQQSNKKTQGQTGDGSFHVQLQTTSGNITVK
ncbi:DUF4097 family beta strand repeat-containing protein [Paenibacillus sp. GCM10027626]|uniref:DUF4097 family beta strand repeat-containing protein n=1 Tax=Paenibacillus sp. GCM10027626 TaxID=3273411 RepID=UPI00362F8CDE